MKKNYISPKVEINELNTSYMICGSIVSTGGDAGIDFGHDEETTTAGDSRRGTLWDDEF